MSYGPITGTVEKPATVTDTEVSLRAVPIVQQPIAATSVSATLPTTRVQFAEPQRQRQARVSGTRPRPRPGRWLDSICDWPSNFFPSCWCVCCCCYGMYLNAQMAQKVEFASFKFVIWTTVSVWVIAFLLSIVIGVAAPIWIPLIFSWIFALMLRMHVVRHQGIRECGSFGEFCAGFFCWYCSVTQMARHLYGYSHALDGDSLPTRPDNYGPPVGDSDFV